jgi:hypothetical protein
MMLRVLGIGLPLLGLALGVWGTSSASASVAVALDLEALTQSAEDVVLAECVREGSRYDEAGRIVTDVTLEVHDALKGSHLPGEQVELTLLGGVVGDVGMRVPGEAHLPVGREAIVFAHRANDGRVRTVGMAQGVLPVERASGRAMVHPGARGLHLVAGTTGTRTARATGALDEPAPLDEVLDRIRSIVAAQGGARP